MKLTKKDLKQYVKENLTNKNSEMTEAQLDYYINSVIDSLLMTAIEYINEDIECNSFVLPL